MIIPIIAIGLFGLITADNLIKKIMCLAVIENTIILSFIRSGFREGAAAPILVSPGVVTVDPIPHAIMLTAIVIGVCFNSLAIACIVRLHQKTGTVLISEIHEL